MEKKTYEDYELELLLSKDSNVILNKIDSINLLNIQDSNLFVKLFAKNKLISDYLINKIGVSECINQFENSNYKSLHNYTDSLKLLLIETEKNLLEQYNIIRVLRLIQDDEFVLKKLKQYDFLNIYNNTIIFSLFYKSDDIIKYLMTKIPLEFCLKNISDYLEIKIVKKILDIIKNRQDIINNLPVYLKALINTNDYKYIINKIDVFNLPVESLLEYMPKILNLYSDNMSFDKIKEIFGEHIYEYVGNNIHIVENIIEEKVESNFNKNDLYNCWTIIKDKELFYKIFSKDISKKFKNITNQEIIIFIKYNGANKKIYDLVNALENHYDKFKCFYNKAIKHFEDKKGYGFPMLLNISYIYINNKAYCEELNNLETWDNQTLKKIFDLIDDKNNITSKINDIYNNLDAISNINITSAFELKNIILKIFTQMDFYQFGDFLSSYINEKTIEKILNKNNKMSSEQYQKVKKLEIFIKFLTDIYFEEDYQILLECLRNINGSKEEILEMIFYCRKLKEKVREVYEIDSNVSLIRLSSLPDNLFNSNKGYYDLSNSEYGLYAHATTVDSLEGLIYPNFQGSNIISLTGISDQGFKGFYKNNDELVVLYDFIPEGNFIASSPYNIVSRNNFNNNDIGDSKIVYNQMEFKDNTKYKMYEKSNHSETNVYRENMVPAGILVLGEKPSSFELNAQKKLSELLNKKIPLIKVQEIGKKINIQRDSAKNIPLSTEVIEIENKLELLLKKSDRKYSPHKIGVLTDVHGLSTVLEETLKDMKKRGITEIYSLGDNFVDGPDPKGVAELLKKYKVKSIAGNGEFYMTIGIDPFSYLKEDRIENILWCMNELGEETLKEIENYPVTIELLLGDKKIALCHFAKDVRYDYNSVWEYIRALNKEDSGYLQFSETNSEAERMKLNVRNIEDLHAISKPLFNGKKIEVYDTIIQGHAHFCYNETTPFNQIHTIRANGIGYSNNDKKNRASYIILEETNDGYKYEEVLIKYNRLKLIESIINSQLPNKNRIFEFIGITDKEQKLLELNNVLKRKLKRG